jgi:hypothetical protein
MRRRPHLTRWALLIYRSSRLSCAAKAAIRSFSSRRSRSITIRRVFASQQLLSDRGDLRGRDTYSGYRCKPAVFRALSTRNSRAGASLAGKPQKKAQAVLSGEGEGRTPGPRLCGEERNPVWGLVRKRPSRAAVPTGRLPGHARNPGAPRSATTGATPRLGPNIPPWGAAISADSLIQE